MRNKDDPTYAGAMYRLRLNQPTADDIAIINSRFLPSSPVPEEPQISENATYICGGNNERETINDFAFIQHCLKHKLPNDTSEPAWRTQGAIRIEMTFEATSKSRTFTEDLGKYIRNMSEAFFDKSMAGNLDLVIGGPLLIKQNMNVNAGIANGTRCILHDVFLKPNATLNLTTATFNGESYHYYTVKSTDVDGLLVKHTLKFRQEQQFFPSLPKVTFLILMP
jgi:hypothetical protein